MPPDNGGMATRYLTRSLATAALVVVLVGCTSSVPTSHPDPSPEAFGGPVTPLEVRAAQVADDGKPKTKAQQALVDFALGRFAAQGLELPPDLKIEFHDSVLEIGGREGVYVHSTRSLHMGTLSKRTMLHELAHAWAAHSLTEEQRISFTAYRGLEAWNDHDYPWSERATEHAAEIVAWALLDQPNHVPSIERRPDGSSETVYRLLTIEDSDVETLVEAFRFLTGQDPVFRNPAEWTEQTETLSPEVMR